MDDSEALVQHDVVVEDGVRFVSVVDSQSRDPHARELAAGVYPASCRHLFSLLRDRAPRGGRILDVGGYIGGFTLAAAARGYEVACVEASPANVAILEKAVQLNGFDRVHIVHAAASDRDGTVAFLPNGPWGWVVSPEDHSERVVRVPCVRLDHVLSTLGWDTVDFIKLDVEGSELAALRGLADFCGGRLPPIVFECNGHTLAHHGIEPARLTAAFEQLGYRLYSIEGAVLRPVEPGGYQADCLVDYLATRELPKPLMRHSAGKPLGRDEVKRRTLRSLRSANTAVRRYSADALARAPDWLLQEHTVIAQLGELSGDPEETIRVAVETTARTRNISMGHRGAVKPTTGGLRRLWARFRPGKSQRVG